MLVVGAQILSLLHEPATVSDLWHRTSSDRLERGESQISFDWFALTLTLLFALEAVHLDERGLVMRSRSASTSD